MKKMVKSNTFKIVLIVLLISQIVGCNNTGADGASSPVDTLAIIKKYNSNHRMYPYKKPIDSFMHNIASPDDFFETMPNEATGTTAEMALQHKAWAKESIQAFRSENEVLMANETEHLNGYFVPIKDINDLIKSCTDPAKKISGIRLYFGKNIKDGATKGQYTHFIFPTYKSGTGSHDDMKEFGFIEQIKPCPSGGCSSRDILDILP